METTEATLIRQLAEIVLPAGVLEEFEITKVYVEETGKVDARGCDVRIIHINLDERDMREREWHDLRPNGFTESATLQDFPIRDHKVCLHVRRRRWLNDDGKSIILERPRLVADGTSYSKELAVALKKIFGYLPDTCEFS